MPFPSALTTDQYNTLRGTGAIPSYAASEYAIFCPNTVVFKAQVNGAPTGTSFAQVTFDNVTTGAYTDIVVGQTVLIGSDSDIRNATFLGRVRKSPTSSVLYIQETSESILNDANIWVIKDFRVWDRLARQVTTTQYKDYDISFTTPAPLIYGLQSAYAGIASGSPEVWTYSFAPSALPITSGATINGAGWQWTIPAGMTITVGSDTTQNITAEFDAGFADWVSVEVPDSNGKIGVFHFFVGVAASDLSNVVNLNIVPGGISGDDNGWTASVEAFAGIDTMLDNTLLVLFDTEYYNGVQTNILSNVKLVGRIRKESNNTVSDATYSQLKKATLDIEGTLAQFSRIEHLPFTLLNKATPTKFDEIKDLTLWRAIAYTLQWHSTYLTLHSLTFDSTDNTFLYLALPTQGGNILSVVQDIAVSINATIESAPQGETRVYRDGVYLSGAQRAALVTVANLTMQDLISIDGLDITQVDTTGKIQGSGGFYNSVSGKVTSLLSLAPGVAQGIGDVISPFSRQVLQANVTQATAQAELNTRTGHEFAVKRREETFLSVSMPPGYNFLVPSLSQWYTWTIPASDTTGGRAFTSAERWQLFSVSYQQDNNAGTKSPIQITFKLECSGTPGQTVVYPPQTQIAPILPVVPVVPPFPTFPPLPDIILPPDPTSEDTPPYIPAPVSNGNTVAYWDTSGIWVASDVFYTNAPGWREITPDGTLTYTCFQWVGLGSKGAYAIGNDGVDSVFFYTEDAISPGAIWTETAITGLYTKIRVGSTQGEVYIMSVEEDWCYTFDFTLTDGGFTVAGFGTYSPGVGWVETSAPLGAAINVTLGISPTTITSVSIDITFGSAGFGRNVSVRDDITMQVLVDYLSVASGPGTFSNSGLFTGIEQLVLNPSTGGGVYDSITITSLTICGNGPNPFGGGGSGIQTRYSTDNGEIFDPLESAGTSPGSFVGIDTQKVGTVALIGTSGQVKKAVSGGAWGDYGDPMPAGASPAAIWIPAKQFGGTTNNSGTNPEYLVASDVLTAGNAALWTVDTSGTVFTDITPSVGGVFGVAASQDCIAMPFVNGNKIAVIMDHGGDIHLHTSNNAGGSWTDRGILNAAANYIRFRRGDTQALQLFIANDDELTVSPSLGANLISKNIASDAMIGTEPF